MPVVVVDNQNWISRPTDLSLAFETMEPRPANRRTT